MTNIRYVFVVAIAFFIMVASNVNAQKPAKSLYNTILTMDKQVFDAYNKCDLDKFEDFFARDVEFFNDRTGYTESRHDLMRSMKGLCENGGMIRELVSAKIYPLDFYGAVEKGTQRFYKMVNGKKKLQSTAQFINIWKLDDNEWKITRVISYDHQDK